MVVVLLLSRTGGRLVLAVFGGRGRGHIDIGVVFRGIVWVDLRDLVGVGSWDVVGAMWRRNGWAYGVVALSRVVILRWSER